MADLSVEFIELITTNSAENQPTYA